MGIETPEFVESLPADIDDAIRESRVVEGRPYDVADWVSEDGSISVPDEFNGATHAS